MYSHTPVAVVGRRPHGEHCLVEVPLVPLHDQLVSAADHVDVVGSVELGHHVASKQVAGTSGTHPPPSGIWRRRVVRRGVSRLWNSDAYPGRLGQETKSGWKIAQITRIPSGSDHRRSHMGPSWGTSCFLSMVLIWSSVWMDGDKPPCTQKIYNINRPSVTFQQRRANWRCYWREEIPVIFLTLPSMIAERDK